MKAWLLKHWDSIRSSFWFVPALMATSAGLLAFATVALDESVTDEWMSAQSWLFTGGAEGASLLLGTVAGSMITIATTVFSLTLVALSLASSQLGPRLLRNFMRDRTNQAVLGTFVATFLYCLLVLRTIRRADEVAFVPHVAVSVGMLLAIVSIAVLIYFIHHVSMSIQADEMIARVRNELTEGIERLFPSSAAEARTPAPTAAASTGAASTSVPAAFSSTARVVTAHDDGYVQLIDTDALMELATEHDLVVRLDHRPGDYVSEGHALLHGWPPERLDDDVVTKLLGTVVTGNQRTTVQDLQFGIDQLVEIAVRALSPGINDPFTAMSCVDSLGSTLIRLCRQEMPAPHRVDATGALRLIVNPMTFADFADAAFNQIRQYARASAAVTLRLLETIALVGEYARRPGDRVALLHHAEMIGRGAQEGLPEADDRRRAAEQVERARRSMGGATNDSPAPSGRRLGA